MRKVLRKETGVSTGTQPLSVIMEEKMCDKTFPTAVVTMSGQVKQSLDDIGDAVLSSPIDKILHGDFPILIGHPESWSNPVGQNLLRNLKKNGQVVLHFIDELHQGLESHWSSIRYVKLARECGVPAFGRSTAGNDVVATIFIRLFFFFPFFFPVFFPVFFSPSRPFLIEGVLGSKNLFSESCLERPKT